MAVVLDNNLGIISTKTAKVKSVTLSFKGKKYLEGLAECEFKNGDKLEGSVDVDEKTGKIVFNIRSFS